MKCQMCELIFTNLNEKLAQLDVKTLLKHEIKFCETRITIYKTRSFFSIHLSIIQHLDVHIFIVFDFKITLDLIIDIKK